MNPISIFWHRRDLRLEDNAGLYHALKNSQAVQPIFIFDSNILSKLPIEDRRVDFISRELTRMRKEFQKVGSDLWVFHGTPEEVLKSLVENHTIDTVYTNRDYEPYAKERDKNLFEYFASEGIEFKGYKDHVIFDRHEVMKKDGTPFKVYTPYSKQWKANFTDFHKRSYPTEKYLGNLNQTKEVHWKSLEDIGFEKTDLAAPPKEVRKSILDNYGETRDFPGIDGISRLSVHLRFGTISIRHCVQKALEFKSEKWFNELIWREFYQMILYHFPNVDSAFKPQYDMVEWENNEEYFAAWCEGKTGYPIVDAGMRELNATGFMHNRVRMIVASFLCKHLLIDWRWGEAYFAEKLLDFDLASNNGGWQWASGSGVDAAPYFRIFNPYTQTERFDHDRKYINKWVPEIDSGEYPDPIVDHAHSRYRTLKAYKAALTS